MANKIVFSLFILIVIGSTIVGQSREEIIKTQDSIYKSQVNKTRIDGVYIPKNVIEAMEELDRLSPKESLAKLKTIDEETMAKKLHFGLGRWMVVNWHLNFGSRMSKYLTDLGLKGEDEMSQFLLISYHRHLKNSPLNELELAKEIKLKRELEYRKMMKETHGIDSIVIKKGK